MPQEPNQTSPKPPYNFPFSTIRTFITHLRESVLPSRIDKSLMKRLSGSAQGYMLPALRFFSLVDGRDVPTPALGALVNAETPEAEKPLWRALVEDGYVDLLNCGINLATVSDGEFMEKFGELYDYEGSTLRKGAGFFMGAAEFVGMTLSPHLKKARGPSPGRPSGKRKNGRKRAEEVAEGGSGKEDDVFGDGLTGGGEANSHRVASLPLNGDGSRFFMVKAPTTITNGELTRIQQWLSFQLIVEDKSSS